MSSTTRTHGNVKEIQEEADARRCWPAFGELRPNISDETEFIRRWQRQRQEGYRIVYIEHNERIAVAAGFRVIHTMAWGRILYVDDLVALPAERGHGYGSCMLQWLQTEAQRCACDEAHLDTGYLRHSAHRAYLRNGFTLSCHHLSWTVPR